MLTAAAYTLAAMMVTPTVSSAPTVPCVGKTVPAPMIGCSGATDDSFRSGRCEAAILVDGDSAFWTAGLFPREGMYVCKRNALDGTPIWTKQARRPPQGYLVASSKELFVPCGKGYPVVYDRETGDGRGDLKASGRDGGTWALLSPDEDRFWSGPAEKNAAYQFDTKTRTHVALVPNANYLIVDSAACLLCHRPVGREDQPRRSIGRVES